MTYKTISNNYTLSSILQTTFKTKVLVYITDRITYTCIYIIFTSESAQNITSHQPSIHPLIKAICICTF